MLPLSSCLKKEAYMIASGVICAIYVLCAAILFMGVKEQKGEDLVPSMVITKQHKLFNISQIWM